MDRRCSAEDYNRVAAENSWGYRGPMGRWVGHIKMTLATDTKRTSRRLWTKGEMSVPGFGEVAC